MLIDARTLPADETVETEVCIIGAGPAGVSLARELIGQNFRVCLLESGGLEPNEDVQSLAAEDGERFAGEYPGAYYLRHREFGGTAHRWGIDLGNDRRGVRYVPLDAIDFEKRDGVPYSGWPFSKTHLDPYYDRAQTVCQAGPYTYDPADWEDENSPQLAFTGDRVTTKMFQFGPRDIFIHDYRRELEQASNMTIYIYATAIELETDEVAKTVTRVRVGSVRGPQFWVKAKQFIVALGGIENARLLLLSDKTQKTGLGNQNDLVGRFFMDHPMVRSGLLFPSNPKIFDTMALYDLRRVRGTHIIAKLGLSDEVLRREQLLNINAALFPRNSIYKLNLLRMLFPKGKSYQSKAVRSVQLLLQAARRREIPKDLLQHLGHIVTGLDDMLYFQTRRQPVWAHTSAVIGFDQGGWSELPNKEKQFGVVEVVHITEQAPDPDNRVTIGTELDALGCRKVQLHWRWNEIDRRSILRAQDIFAEEFARAGLGRLKLDRDKGDPHPVLLSVHHHTGTTRMHVDPKQGVVDENCRVHGVSNLFIAGSSVFPTGGFANPTLTIVALSIRLADRIKAVMAASPALDLQVEKVDSSV